MPTRAGVLLHHLRPPVANPRILPVTPGKILFLVFIIVPLIEIYILIKVGGIIGVLPTIALVVLTAGIGSAMLRHQGFATLRKAQANLDQGIVPAEALVDGVFLVIGGALLLTPGFFTDAVGFLCLLPVGRKWLVAQAKKRINVVQVGAPGGEDSEGSGPRGRRTIDGEWQREDD